MTFDYATSKATADRLIERFGQAVTLKRPTNTGTSYNPTVSWASHAGRAVVLNYDNRDVDGTRVLATDKRVMLSKASLSIEPGPQDRLVIGGVEHGIVSVMPLAPGGTTLLYEIQARR